MQQVSLTKISTQQFPLTKITMLKVT